MKEKLLGRHREMQMTTNKLEGNCEGLESGKREMAAVKLLSLYLFIRKDTVCLSRRDSRKNPHNDSTVLSVFK